MKGKEDDRDEDRTVEIFKAAAQAWHGRCISPRPMKEFDPEVSRSNRVRPCSRFRREAMTIAASASSEQKSRWDFSQSLWDSYEIVTLSKKLEDGMVLDHPFDGPLNMPVKKRRRESKNSLRNLFHRISSKRFDDLNIK